MKSAIFAKRKQAGQGMTEYIIIVALIAVAAIGVYSFFGKAIRGQMQGMTNEIAGTSATAGTANATAAATNANVEGAASKGMSNYNNDAARGK